MLYILSRKITANLTAGNSVTLDIKNDTGRQLRAWGYCVFFKNGHETAEIILKTPSLPAPLMSANTPVCAAGVRQDNVLVNPVRRFPKAIMLDINDRFDADIKAIAGTIAANELHVCIFADDAAAPDRRR